VADAPGPAGVPCPVCGHYVNVFGCTPGACKDPERANAHPGEAGFCTHGVALSEPCAACRSDNERQPELARIYPNARNYTPSAAMDAARDAAPADSAPFIASRPELGGAGTGPNAARTIPPTHFAGVPIDDFCATDRAGIEQMAREGKIGIAGMCASCSAKVDAATPVEAPPTVEHPPPWRWTGVDDFIIRNGPNAGQMAYEVSGGLVDAAGADIASVTNSDTLEFASARVRELLRAAPEMEALLRELEDGVLYDWEDEIAVKGCPFDIACPDDVDRQHRPCWRCRRRALLARLDEGSKIG
jgi:hypothetical protein